MSAEARRLWTATVAHALVAVGLLAYAQVSVQRRVPLGIAVSIGVAAAAALFAALARSRAPFRPRRWRGAAFVARGGFFAVRSASEEVTWRWFLLGSLAPAIGAAGALAASTAGFALAHVGSHGRRGAVVHLATGGVFGAVFIATGSLLAAIAAHGSYNLLVLLAVESGATVTPCPAAATAAGRDPPPVASLHGVSKRFGTTQALRNVDFELREGEVMALLGANGAGKTTAISILLGLRRPDSGSACLFGLDPRLPAARRGIGVTPQELGFPPTLTVEEIVVFVRAHYAQPLDVEEVIGRFGLADVRERQAGGLSGGQRRRLSVALAFAGDPSVAFLDEPTSGLDVESRRAVWGVIAEFAAAGGPVLLSTHNLDEADALASRVVVMSEGRVIADASPEEIKAHVGLRRIRLPPQALPALEGVIRSTDEKGRLVLYVDDAGAVVRDLVHAGADLRRLEVLPVSLEEAFVALTGAGR
jgi:ABC-2 type transport system ATP-binding protein